MSTNNKEEKLVNKSYEETIISERWKQYRSPQYFEYRQKWYGNPNKFVVEEFPLHMDIEITTYCNLLCPMCPRTVLIKEGKFGPIEHIDFELFKRIIDEGAKFGLSSVKFNYLGEPLMHPNVAEMVKYCKDKGIVEVMFNTNGVLLTEDMSRKLLDAGIDSLFISFDSADKEKYESIRIGAVYEKVIKNVKKFAELRNSDEKYWHVQIRVSKVLFPEDGEKQVSDFIELWKDTVDAIGIGLLDEEVGPEGMPYDHQYRCDQPWQRMFVRPNGVVFPCCLDHENRYIVGNVNKDSLKDIWQGELYKNLRDAHAHSRYNDIEICKNCTYLCNTKPIGIDYKKES